MGMKKRGVVSPPACGGPDGPLLSTSDQAANAEFQRILNSLPAGLFFIPPPHPRSGLKQLTLPLSSRRARPLRTHPRTPPQAQPKLSPEQQAQALARVRAGDSYRAIALDFGVSHGAIFRLVRATRRQGPR